MIIGCPECHTRFALDADMLRPDGRRVQCGKCSHVWFEEAPPPSDTEPLRVTPLEPDELSTVPSRNLPALPSLDQERTARAAWVLVAFLLVVVLSIAWFGREPISRAWPTAAAIYAAVGIDAFPPPGDGLSVEMSVKRVDDRLRLSGEIANVTDESRQLPPLYAVLSNATGKRLQHWMFTVDARVLGPGERVPFTTESDSIPEGTANVSVLFNNPAENP